MCLLHKGMRGRTLIDEALATRGLTVSPRLESDSVVALAAHANTGRWACIVPEPWLRTLPPAPGIRVLALLDPPVTARIAVITPAVEPGSVLTRAVLDTARRTPIDAMVRRTSPFAEQ